MSGTPFIRICRDGHRCENGSVCAQDPANEGSYYCDCSTAEGLYAGLYCEFEADTKCILPEESSETWGCYNGGTCVIDVGNGDSTVSCDCPENYEGDFCQFVKGSVPPDWPVGLSIKSKSSGGSSGLEAGVMAAIIIVVVFVVALFGYVIYRKRRQGKDDGESDGDVLTPRSGTSSNKMDPSEALNIETDGETFRDIVKSMSSRGSAQFDFEAADEMSRISVEIDRERPRTPGYEDQPTKNGSAKPRII